MEFADPAVRARMQPLFVTAVRPGEADMIEEQRKRHRDPAFRARDEAEIMLRKNWTATGSFLKEDRPRALDLLGFASQLVFNTFANKHLCAAEHGDDVELAYGVARAHNRAMADFCSVDTRLLATGYVPLRDFAKARDAAEEALRLGCKALLFASACPRGHSPSHVGLDPVWALAAGSRRADRAARRRRRTAARPELLRERPARRCPTSTAAPRTSARSTTCRSRYPVMQTLATHDHRRRARALPAPAGAA